MFRFKTFAACGLVLTQLCAFPSDENRALNASELGSARAAQDQDSSYGRLWKLTSHSEMASERGFVDDLDRLFVREEAKGFSGVVLFARGDDVLFRKSYGVSGCNGPPLNVGDAFLIGSVTKVFTKLAIYHLVAEGKLKLDDSISLHLSGVPGDKRAITVDMLARHQSGLDNFLGEDGRPVTHSVEWDYLPVTKFEIIERAMKSALIYKPGKAEKYSNLGYSLLAAIIESASGTSFENYVRSRVFEPLGMLHTGYALPNWSGTHLTDGCDEGEIWEMPYSVDDNWMSDGPSWNVRGNGGMMGTADDLLTWIDALHRRNFLPPQVMDDYFSDATGLSRVAAFEGGNGIFNAYYLWLADSDLRLIMISNNSEHQVESYIEAIRALIKQFKQRLLSDLR